MQLRSKKITGRGTPLLKNGSETTPHMQLRNNKIIYKRKRTNPRDDEDMLPGLPNQVAMDCIFSRIPRLLRPLLSEVCKAWRYNLSSQEISIVPPNASRGFPRNYIYVRLLGDMEQYHGIFAWNLQERVSLRLPQGRRQLKNLRLGTLAVGCGTLFCIGREAWVYDPLINTWSPLPPQKVPRRHPAMGCIDGRIYVLGGCPVDSADWAEVYDPSLARWTTLSVSDPKIRALGVHGRYSVRSVVANGKMYGMFGVYGEVAFVFDPTPVPSLTTVSIDVYRNGLYRDINRLFASWARKYRLPRAAAVVKGIPFIFWRCRIQGYDFEENEWHVLRSVQGFIKRMLCIDGRDPDMLDCLEPQLANVEDKLCVIHKEGNEDVVKFACLDVRYDRAGRSFRSKVLWHNSLTFVTGRRRPVEITDVLSN